MDSGLVFIGAALTGRDNSIISSPDGHRQHPPIHQDCTGLHAQVSLPNQVGETTDLCPTGETEAQKGQVTFSRSPREVYANQERSCRCPISSCSYGFLMCLQHPGAARPLLPPSPQPLGALAPTPLTLASRRSHHGETGGVCPEPFPGWPCPRPSGS